jgi:hypothetical protein
MVDSKFFQWLILIPKKIRSYFSACPKHPTYPLDQSILPRKVLEGAQRLEDLAERQHLESCRRIEKDAAELLPQAGHIGHGAP